MLYKYETCLLKMDNTKKFLLVYIDSITYCIPTYYFYS